ncbi:hypothetical protein [Streptomyces uncialis]|uniref:hypothetical protein n=1 Tax=Streptomyces uncialis TaxID=1048205 RepID=UPI0037956AFE
MTETPMTPERLAEARALLKTESSITFYSARAKDTMLLLLAEVERLRSELDKAHDELTGTCLALWEEEQDTARLRVATRNARERAARFRPEVKRLQGQRRFLMGQLAKRDAESGRADEAVRQFLAGEQPIAEAENAPSAAEPLTVYRASHDSIPMGLYTSRAAARAHCEAYVRRELGDTVFLGWVPDDDSEQAPEELSAGHDIEPTGYVVTPLEVAAAYDGEADE